QVFGLWALRVQPAGLEVIIRGRDAAQDHYQHEDPRHVVPGPDGQTIFTGMGLFDNQLMQPGDKARPDENGFCVPAQQGSYYLQIAEAPRFPKGAERCAATVHKLGNPALLLEVPRLDASLGAKVRDWESGDYDKRLNLLPGAKLLVAIPYSNDRLVL